jgi:hypothetical protein
MLLSLLMNHRRPEKRGDYSRNKGSKSTKSECGWWCHLKWDPFQNASRSREKVVNVLGNCLATVMIPRWEGDFEKERPSPVVMNALAG